MIAPRLKELIQKLEHYCAYQERCHVDVEKKLFTLNVSPEEKEKIILHLIENNFLNEERFAFTFTQGKFHQKLWGRIRIKNELKSRNISDYLIRKALSGIPEEDYEAIFSSLSEKQWQTLSKETNYLKKRKKICDFLLRKGFEADKVYEKALELEKNSELS